MPGMYSTAERIFFTIEMKSYAGKGEFLKEHKVGKKLHVSPVLTWNLRSGTLNLGDEFNTLSSFGVCHICHAVFRNGNYYSVEKGRYGTVMVRIASVKSRDQTVRGSSIFLSDQSLSLLFLSRGWRNMIAQ